MSSARFLGPPFTYSHVIPLTARNWRSNMFILPLFANLFHSKALSFQPFPLFTLLYILSTFYHYMHVCDSEKAVDIAAWGFLHPSIISTVPLEPQWWMIQMSFLPFSSTVTTRWGDDHGWMDQPFHINVGAGVLCSDGETVREMSLDDASRLHALE